MSKTPEYLDSSTTDDHISTRLRVPDDLAHTEGHFEGAPIVPGVVLIDWALTLASDTFSEMPKLSEIRNVKFKKPLQPGDTCTLEINWNANQNTLRFTFKNGEQIRAKGTFRMSDTQDR